MKKILIILVLLAVIGASVAAQNVSLSLRPEVCAILTPSEEAALRGAGAGAKVLLNFIGLTAGIEALFEYDIAFSIASIPVSVIFGFENFYAILGNTFALGVPTLGEIRYELASFPNTYGLGVRFTDIALGPDLSMGIYSQVTYTPIMTEGSIQEDFTDALANLLGILLGLKIYAGVDFDFNFPLF